MYGLTSAVISGQYTHYWAQDKIFPLINGKRAGLSVILVVGISGSFQLFQNGQMFSEMPLLAFDHCWKIWYLSWLSSRSACVATLTASSQDLVTGNSNMMWWTGITPKLTIYPQTLVQVNWLSSGYLLWHCPCLSDMLALHYILLAWLGSIEIKG